MEEANTEFLTVLLPAIGGVVVIAATMAVAFWLGAGRQTSYEDAMKRAEGRAEEALRTEQKQKKEKKRGGERRKKAEGSFGSKVAKMEPESTHQPPAQRKGILKSNKANTAEKAEPSSSGQVDFQLTGTPAKERSHRVNPPTPHPSAQRSKQTEFKMEKATKGVEEEEGEGEEEEVVGKHPQLPDYQDQPKPKPKPKPVAQMAAQAPPTAMLAGVGSPKGRKKSKKPKQVVESFDTNEALPASRIADIVTASSLSDENIQQLIEQLLEKMHTNTEWQAANMKTDNVKSLKKANQDLQSRCSEAEKTVQGHSIRIKELRAEIQKEQARHQLSEAQLQNKISQQSSEISVARTKISGLEEELRQTRATSSSHAYQTLQEEFSALQQQMNSLMQENASLSNQLSSQGKTLQEAQEQAGRLKIDLRRSREGARGGGGGGGDRSLLDKVSELEGRLHQSEEEKSSLQSALESLQLDNDKMAERLEEATSLARERDSLSLQLNTAKQELQEAQVTIQTMTARPEAEGEEEGKEEEESGEEGREELREKVRELETKNARLVTEMESLQQQKEEEAAKKAEVPEGPSTAEQLAELKTQLTARHAEEREALVGEMEGKRREEVRQMEGQYELELVSVHEQLSRAEGERDETLAFAREQLVSESAIKERLQAELEALKAAATQNGLMGEETDAGSAGKGEGEGEEEGGERVSLKVHEEALCEKEAELGRVRDECARLQEVVREAEGKLDELRVKNNSLRDKSWKARDEMAQKEKEMQAKLKEAYQKAEERVRDAQESTRYELQEAEMALLLRLFPEVIVDDSSVSSTSHSSSSFPAWADQFESQASQVRENSKNQISHLTERVQELQQGMHEASLLRDTLEKTMGMLANLKTEVDQQNAMHQEMLQERDEMLQRERVTNRDLQHQLNQQTEASSKLGTQLAKVDEVRQKKVQELEERLQETSHQHMLFQEEAETLRHSLQHELELKNEHEEAMDQLETKCRQLQEELKTEQEAMQRMKEQEAMQQMKEQEAMQQMKEQEAMQQIKFEQSPAPEAVDTDELRKLGDSVMRPIVISSDSTEV